MGAMGAEGETRMKLDYKLFKGVSVQLHDVENADKKAAKMAAMPAIKNMWPVEVFDIPTPKVQWTGSPAPDSETSSLQKRANTTDTFSPHVMTQVDKLRAKGITGKGIKIAVIDTGVSGCAGPTLRVSRLT